MLGEAGFAWEKQEGEIRLRRMVHSKSGELEAVERLVAVFKSCG
jgi:hypothetical protein